MANDSDIINSIDRALDVLLILHEHGQEMGVTEISSALGIYKSTIYRTLNTLQNKGFISQNPDNGKYWLGLKLYVIGMAMKENLPLTKTVHPYAEAISTKFKEVVHLSVLDINAAQYPQHIIIDKVTSHHVLSFTPAIGSSAACHCSAVGKCLLAFSPAGYIEKFVGNPLPVYTDKTITDWNKLQQELMLIRRQGYAVDNEELERGLTCIASPIMGSNNEAIAALSLSGPTARLNSERFKEIVAELKKTTIELSALLR